MAITEIITSSLKQDDGTITQFSTVFQPLLASNVRGAHGLRSQFFGQMVFEDNENVEGEYRVALGLEWTEAQNFLDFVASPQMAEFFGMVKPLVTAPPHPGIYETDFSPEAAFSSAVTEVFRIEAPDVQRAAKVGEAWGYLINSMGKRLPELKSLSGLSLNYEQTQFLGIIGWDSLKHRETLLQDVQTSQAKKELEILEGVTSFVASFEAM